MNASITDEVGLYGSWGAQAKDRTYPSKRITDGRHLLARNGAINCKAWFIKQELSIETMMHAKKQWSIQERVKKFTTVKDYFLNISGMGQQNQSPNKWFKPFASLTETG